MGEILHHVGLPIWVNCVDVSNNITIYHVYLLMYLQCIYLFNHPGLLIKQKQPVGSRLPLTVHQKLLGWFTPLHSSPVGWRASRLTPRRARCHCECQCVPTSKAPRIRRPPRWFGERTGMMQSEGPFVDTPPPQKKYSTCPRKMQKKVITIFQ